MLSKAPASNPRASSRRRLTRILAGALLVVGIGSCASTLKLDEYRSASSELCGMLDRCFEATGSSQCEGEIEHALAMSGNESVASWLNSFSDLNCLESCSSARRCLDLPLICVKTAACSTREDCCGFSQGVTDCEQKPMATEKTCCARSGAECHSDNDCCAEAGDCRRTAENPNITTCGGFVCRPAEAACVIDAQCCTGTCVNRLCADTICSDNKFRCTLNNECCSKFCNPASGRCDEPRMCVASGEACSVFDSCCEPTFTCQYSPGSAIGTCADAMCIPSNADCATDSQCCSGHCDTTFFVCSEVCHDQDLACTSNDDCCSGKCEAGACKASCSLGYCAVDDDCCTGACVAGACKPECNAPAAHGVCSVGPPIDVASDDACVQQVCDKDPYCCCGKWDEACVLAAKNAVSACSCQ